MHRCSALLPWFTRPPKALHLRALVLLAFAEVALSGAFTAPCSAAVQRQFAQPVKACPLAVLTQVSSCAPSGPDFATAAANCAPGCKCAEASVGKTGEPYIVFGMHAYCNAQFNVRVLHGAMSIDPFINCNRITYCPFCVAAQCRYECADISAQSCAAQLFASVAQLDAPDAPRETAAAGEVSAACLASAGDKGSVESATSPEKAASVNVEAPADEAAYVGDANAPTEAASVEETSSEKASSEKASSEEASSEEASSEKAYSEQTSSEKEEPKQETVSVEEIIGIISGFIGFIGVVVAIITLRYQRMSTGSASNESRQTSSSATENKSGSDRRDHRLSAI